MRISIAIPKIAAAGLVSAVLLAAANPAAARVVLSACQTKHSYCTERCIMNNKTFDKQSACIKRTCDKQNPGCGPSSGGGKNHATTGGSSTGSFPPMDNVIVGPGLLETVGGGLQTGGRPPVTGQAGTPAGGGGGVIIR